MIKEKAKEYLINALNNPNADFRDGQWESIEGLLNRKRMLVVERTGWGKSMVYFLATKLLREQGKGPTLLISPLLSLMRNQLDAANRIGIDAKTINSTNNEEWEEIKNDLRNNKIDILLISPERLANEYFRSNVLSFIAEKIGLFVIDEAHCISDWGHDFRPDYRRIVRVLQAIPSNIPVLATTATANDRVVRDVVSQLGDNIELIRGNLVRKSLKLQNINMPSPSARMAWLAEIIPQLPGSGIIYTLTIRDTERLTEWLKINDIKVKSYHSNSSPAENEYDSIAKHFNIALESFILLSDSDKSTYYKEYLEHLLINNEVKALVATVALGMGFDKPDLGFAVHFQRPSSVVHYYQQVGRAGRAVDEAYGILLCGEEDDNIANYFIRSAFPPQRNISEILKVLDSSESGLSVPEMQKILNLSKSQINKTLKFLTVEFPSPIVKIGSKWFLTASSATYKIDQDYVNEITSIREQEQKQMQEYMNHQNCLMNFLENALDDPNTNPCGKCFNCNPLDFHSSEFNQNLANRAALFLKRSYQPINPRKKWPISNMFESYTFDRSTIPVELRYSEGRALSLWRDAGWGQLVASGKYEENRFSDELVEACVEMLENWAPTPKPEWITCIPSLNHPTLVQDFTERLAIALNIPFVPCLIKAIDNPQQKFMKNSYQQAKNLDGAFAINSDINSSPCLLIDDIVDSRWTFTVASALIRQSGCSAVYPLALALNSPRMD